jgi:hypothetical protein
MRYPFFPRRVEIAAPFGFPSMRFGSNSPLDWRKYSARVSGSLLRGDPFFFCSIGSSFDCVLTERHLNINTDHPERFVNAFTLGAFFATLDGQGPCEIEMPHCQKILKPWRGIQYVEHTEGDGVEMFKAHLQAWS